MASKSLPDGMEVSVFCPECIPRVKLVVRTNRANGSQFLGCPNWPKCRHTQSIPMDVIMRLQGAVPLPGFL
jgi:ssDNA-binding Zn-finger/Zn-ribbon topoisomerase 1